MGDRGESGFPGSDNTPEGLPGESNEVGIANQVIFAALEDGTFTAFDLRSGRSMFRSPTRGPGLSAIAYSSKDNMIATGSTNGVISIWDTRALETGTVTSFMRNSSAIEDIAFVDLTSQSGAGTGVTIAAADALPYVASVLPEGPHVVAELLGVDCERVAHVRVQGVGTWGECGDAWVWTAADDGFVRRY
jgi:proteasomal ATPase-associated factor 1